MAGVMMRRRLGKLGSDMSDARDRPETREAVEMVEDADCGLALRNSEPDAASWGLCSDKSLLMVLVLLLPALHTLGVVAVLRGVCTPAAAPPLDPSCLSAVAASAVAEADTDGAAVALANLLLMLLPLPATAAAKPRAPPLRCEARRSGAAFDGGGTGA